MPPRRSSIRHCESCCRHIPTSRSRYRRDYGLADIVADRFDAGVRLGRACRQGHDRSPIAPEMRQAIVGSPAYFEAVPGPERRRTSGPRVHQYVAVEGARTLRLGVQEGRPATKGEGERPMAFNAIAIVRAAALDGLGRPTCRMIM